MAPSESEKLLATLDPKLRRAFDAWTQQQLLEQLAANPTDPYAAARAMLEREEQQAAAGFVPPSEPTQQGWYIVPPTEDPRVAVIRPKLRLAARLPGNEQQRMVAALVLVVLLTGVAIYASWPKAQAAARTTPAPAAPVAAVPFPASDTITSTVPLSNTIAQADTDGVQRPQIRSADLQVPVSLEWQTSILRVEGQPSAHDGAWSPQLRPGVAVWLQGSRTNRILCVAATAPLLDAKAGDPLTLRLRSGAVLPYTIARTATVGQQETSLLDQRQAALTVLGCHDPKPTRRVVVATAQAVVVPTPTPTPPGSGGDLVVKDVGAHSMAAPGSGARQLWITVAVQNPHDQAVVLDDTSLQVYDAASGKAIPFVRTPLPATVAPKATSAVAVAVPLPASRMAILAGGPAFAGRQWHISLPTKEP